jgi:hypothetical protein
MLNFGIAYMVLRVLFFKPTIAILHREQVEHDVLEHIIADRRALCLKKEHEIDDSIQLCKQFFSDHKPRVKDLSLVMFKESTPSIVPKPLDKKTIQDATEHIKQVLIKRIEHVS